jgi:hypothetical protein
MNWLTLTKDNHYCARDYGQDAPNQNSYHYSNKSVSCMSFQEHTDR